MVLNHFLEEQMEEDRVNKKDKAGNSLKCKNQNKYIQRPGSNISEEDNAYNSKDCQPKPGPSKRKLALTTATLESQEAKSENNCIERPRKLNKMYQ